MKKFLPHIIIIAVMLIGISAPIFIYKAHAANIITSLFGDPIDIVGEVINKIFAFVGNIILWLVSRVLWITSHIFDSTLKMTVVKNTYSDITAVKEGWTAARDVVNLFFILILLYVAIATILQVSGYGMKELLVRVIIIALLVNFSLMITRVIIDASNILALEFYNKIITESKGVQKTGDVTGAMMAGLRLPTIYKADNLSGPDQSTNLDISKIIAVTFLGSILILVTAFVFFAATILFVARTIILLFLMILSPLAFLAMALPATKGYASKWWKTLFDQAFFAPAFLFLIYLVFKIIESKDFEKLLAGLGNDSQAAFSGALTGNDPGTLGVVVNFLILIGLMIGSLIIAKSMGAYGAKTMINWGQKARKSAQGYAGKISKRGAGWAAEKTLDEKSWVNRKTGGAFAKSAALMPGATRGLARVSSWREKQLKEKQDKYKKIYGSYSDAGLNAMLKKGDFGPMEVGLEAMQGGPRITEAKKKAIEGVLLERTYGKERKDTEKARIITLISGEKLSLEEAEKQILSLKKEVIAKGDRADVAQKKLTELVLASAKTKKKHKDEFGGEEGLTEKKVKDMISESSKGTESKPPA